MQSLHIVETQGFQNLIRGLCGSNIQMPSRKSLKSEIVYKYDNCLTKLKKIIEDKQYICTTTDLWSCHNKSFIGMTAHFINSDLKRESYVLSFERMVGSHTHAVLGRKIYEIHSKFNIERKVTDTVTDNAKNFTKAFETFHDDEIRSDTVDDDNDDAVDDDEDDDIIVEDIPSFDIEEGEGFDDNFDISLPSHIRCCSHTMNLVATTDIENIVTNSKNSIFKKQYRSVFAKLKSFFNLSRRSTKSQDIILEICQCRFPQPSITRWNSLYDAVKKIYCKKNDVVKVFEALNLTSVTTTEWEFLKEYLDVMAPLAYAIDYFQGNNLFYYIAVTLLPY